LSELWRVPFTRATNADFAHHYELYEVWRKPIRTDEIRRKQFNLENTSFKVFFTFDIINSRVLFFSSLLPPIRGGEVLFGEGPLHPIPGQLEAFLAHGDARQLSLHI
jgi:hypothetical protein